MKNNKRYTLALTALLALALTAFAPRVNAAPYCLTDVFGYVWNLNVTPAGGGLYNFSGTVVGAWTSPGSVSGTFNRNTNAVTLTATNPAPDGCVSASGSFTYSGTRSGTTLNFTWTNDCGASGSGSGSVAKGACRIGIPTVDPAGPGAALRSAITDVSMAPNPAADVVTFNYTLNESSDLIIQVMDMSGRTVASLNQGVQPAGNYTISWDLRSTDGADLPNGLYLVRCNNQTDRLMIQR